jgi:O-antigen/teichoic acid export membrane protein
LRDKLKALWARDFVKNVFHTLASRGVLIGIGLVTNILITRGLGPENKGVYGLVMTMILVGIQFGHLGMHSSNTYFVARDKSIWGRLFANSIGISIVSGTVISGMLLLFNFLQPNFFKIPGGLHYGLIIVIATPLALMSLLFKNLLMGVQLFKKNNYFEIVSRIVYALVIVGLYITGHLNVLGALLAFLVEHIAVIIIEGLYMRKHAPKPHKPSASLFRTNISYGLRAYIAVFLAFLVIRSDVFLVNYFLDMEKVGYYHSAVFLIDQFNMLATVVAGILMPRLTSSESVEYRYKLNMKVVKTMAIVLALIGLFLVLAAKPLILLLYGEPYLPSVSSFRVLVVAAIFLSLETLMAQFIAATGMPIQIVWYWLFAFALNLILNIIFIPMYGEVGAAYASVISYFLILVLVYRFMHLKSRLA